MKFASIAALLLLTTFAGCGDDASSESLPRLGREHQGKTWGNDIFGDWLLLEGKQGEDEQISYVIILGIERERVTNTVHCRRDSNGATLKAVAAAPAEVTATTLEIKGFDTQRARQGDFYCEASVKMTTVEYTTDGKQLTLITAEGESATVKRP